MDYSKENKESFFKRLDGKFLPSEVILIKTAYMIAKHGHRAQLRKETDIRGNKIRYFEHVRRSALIGIDNSSINAELICSLLLHDTIEDCEDIDAEIIEGIFGSRIARIVMSVTKRPGLKIEDYIKQINSIGYAGHFVKICDRIDNLNSLGTDVSQEFREKKIKETLNYYIPMWYNTTVPGTLKYLLAQTIRGYGVTITDSLFID